MTDIWANTDDLPTPPHWDILGWIEQELAYADRKRERTHRGRERDDEEIRAWGLTYMSAYRADAEMYIHRAMTLGIGTPGGRQALGKAICVLIAGLEGSLRVFGGTMPPPGKPSGDIGAVPNGGADV